MRRAWLVLGIVALLGLGTGVACSVGQQIARGPTRTPTRTPKPTFTPTPLQTPTPLVLPTATPVQAGARPSDTPLAAPTNTPLPTATPLPPTDTPPPPTPTPLPQPVVIVNSDRVNVRAGPGTAYGIIGQVTRGTRLQVQGRNPAGDWWQVCCVNGQAGWIIDNLVTREGDFGGVQVAANIPPTPTRRPTPLPTPTPVPQPTPTPAYPFQLLRGVEKCTPNAGITYFDGFVRYRNNAPRNGVCVHIAFYGPRNTKCSGCDGVGDGVWSFAPFGQNPAPRGTTVEIYVVSCPPGGMPPGGQTEGTGFGDLTPRSDKWVYTVGDSVECHGITFVGD